MKWSFLPILISPLAAFANETVIDPIYTDLIPWEIHFREDLDQNGQIETAGSILLQQFQSIGGQISFDFTFLTSEVSSYAAVPLDYSTEEPYESSIVHDVFRVGLWEIDSQGQRTGEFQFLTGGAVNQNYGSTDPAPYTGTFTPYDFSYGGTLPGPWGDINQDTTTLPDENETLVSVYRNYSGAVEGSFTGTFAPGNWEIEFLVAHANDYVVNSAIAIDNIVAPGLVNGNFENGLAGWFFIGDVALRSNAFGPNPPMVKTDYYEGQYFLQPGTILPTPGGGFEPTGPNSYALVNAPDVYFIPEPSTYFMIISGLGLTAIYLYRRNKAQMKS